MRDTICPEVKRVTFLLVILFVLFLSLYEYLIGDLFPSTPTVALKHFQSILNEELGCRV